MLFWLQEVLEAFKWPIGRFWALVHGRAGGGACTRLVIKITGMFIVMAVNAKIFPVAAIQRVVVVIVVLVVNREQMQILAGERAPAATAHPRVNLERQFAISAQAIIPIPPRPCNDFVEPA